MYLRLRSFSRILSSSIVTRKDYRPYSYPVLICPSYALSSTAMNVVCEESSLEYNLSAAASVSPLHAVVITKFIDNAQEIDVDAVAHKGKLLVHSVSEHVENSGVHSGNATLVLPPFSLTETDISRLKVIAEKVAEAFKISGHFNMQIIKKPAAGPREQDGPKVIECNLRASRSFPFVSKVLGHNFIDTLHAQSWARTYLNLLILCRRRGIIPVSRSRNSLGLDWEVPIPSLVLVSFRTP